MLFTFYIQDVLKLKKNNSGTKRLIAVTVSNITYHFPTQSPCNTIHLLYHSSNFCIPAEKKLFGCAMLLADQTTFISNTCSNPDLNLSTHSWTFRWLTALCPYWANTRRWISTRFTPSAPQNEPHYATLFFDVAILQRSVHLFVPRCFHSTEGRALYCACLNSSTGTVNTAQCVSSSLFRLPRNLKIVFTFWYTLVKIVAWVSVCIYMLWKIRYFIKILLIYKELKTH